MENQLLTREILNIFQFHSNTTTSTSIATFRNPAKGQHELMSVIQYMDYVELK